MSEELQHSDDHARPSPEQMRTLLDGLKDQAAEAGVGDGEVEDLGHDIRIGIRSLGDLHRFLGVATCGGPLPYHFDVYFPIEHVANVVDAFLDHNEGPWKSRLPNPPAR